MQQPSEADDSDGDGAPMMAGGTWTDQVSAVAIVELDSEGVVRSWNAGAERIKGYRREDIVGQHFSRFYRLEDRSRDLPQRLLSSALRDGYVEDTGWRVRADGDLFWAHVTITAIRDAHELPAGFVKIVRDLTARKRADDEMTAFLRAFAHDFTSPVTAVRGYVDLLAEQAEGPSPMLDRLSEASDHLLAMAEMLSQRVRADGAAPASEPVDAGTVVREAASMVLPGDLFGRLSFSIAPDTTVLADAGELRRAAQNVLENAAKYSDGLIEVQVRSDEETVDLTVRDEGRGIHPDDLASIFEDGARGRYARSDDGGSGIGLASAKRAVERGGGRISIESIVGGGTTVRMQLPRAGRRLAPV